MRVARRVAVLLVVAIALMSAGAGVTTAHHVNTTEPKYGINETTFKKLWSGDVGELGDARNVSFTEAVRVSSDFSFVEPPGAVGEWNRGSIKQFDGGATAREDSRISVYPEGAELRSGDWVKDAHISLFSISPSTVVHTTGNETRHYVPPEGRISGVVDYRVEPPEGDISCDDGERVLWGFDSNREDDMSVQGVTAKAGGAEIGRVGPLGSATSHVFSMPYTDLPRGAREIRLSAEISVTLQKEIVDCATGATDIQEETQSFTVDRALDVRSYRLLGSGLGTVARYSSHPDGELGVFVYSQRPWSTVRVSGSRVNSVWRFFSARDTSWDRYTVSTRSGETERRSEAHPLRVHAYPSGRGVTTMSGTGGVSPSVKRILGVERERPTLPEGVMVDVVRGNYTATYGLSLKMPAPDTRSVAIDGIVHGISKRPTVVGTGGQRIRSSNLTLSVVKANVTHATLLVSLREKETGEPIGLGARNGEIILTTGESVNTSNDGDVKVTIERPEGSVSARYVPAPWWETEPAYTEDSDTIIIRTRMSLGEILGLGMDFLGVTVPFLLLVYLLDGLFGLGIWPPWRDL